MGSILEIFLIAFVTVASIANFFSIPGNLLIAVGSFLYALSTGFDHFSFTFVLTLFGIMLLVEALEFVLIAVSTKHYGTSRWGVAGAIVGGILGALSGMFFTPILGALIGSLIGVFVGAFLVEFVRNRDLEKSFRASYGAFWGRVGGLSVKIIGAMAMAVMIVSEL